jgi:hypothetical protein
MVMTGVPGAGGGTGLPVVVAAAVSRFSVACGFEHATTPKVSEAAAQHTTIRFIPTIIDPASTGWARSSPSTGAVPNR